MKKYSILLAVIVLVFASLACQTIMGGGAGDYEAPQTDGGEATLPPSSNDDGNITVGGEFSFPVTDDAFNVVSTPQSVTYQTKLSADDVMAFYRDELGNQGFTENAGMSTNFGGIIAMVFEGDGKTIVLGGAPAGDGSISVTLAYQQ